VNYYRRYSGDYLRKTSRLSVIEHGAYSLLLDYYYADEKPLPLDHDELYTMVRAMKPADRAAVDRVLSLFFVRQDDGYHNERADEEIEKAQPAIKAAKENGKKRGSKTNPPDNPVGMPVGSDDDADGCADGLHPPSSILQPLTANLQPPNKKRGAKAPFVLPEWIPEDPWNAWVEARTKAKKPPTEWAKRLAVQKLDNLREQGHPPAQVLMDAAFNNWSGLFPPKEVR
jgi:uncharacterized protein YdaU (DUF1376 family)